MPRHDPDAKNAVLDFWADGKTYPEIPDLIAEMGHDLNLNQVKGIVDIARRNHDSRAARRTNAVYGEGY